MRRFAHATVGIWRKGFWKRQRMLAFRRIRHPACSRLFLAKKNTDISNPSLSAKNIYNSLNIIVNLYSLKSYPYFCPCRPHRAKHPFASVPHPRAGLARWCRDSYAMLATSLLSSPRPTGGVGPWIYRNGSARTRTEFLIFAASIVCHCTLLALSAPPRFNAGRCLFPDLCTMPQSGETTNVIGRDY